METILIFLVNLCWLGLYEMLLKLVLPIDLVILLIDSCNFRRYI